MATRKVINLGSDAAPEITRIEDLKILKRKKPAKRSIKTNFMIENEEISSEPIVVTYTKDYDIDYLHGEVITRIEARIGITEIQEKLSYCQSQLKQRNTIVERDVLEREIRECQKKIQSYLDGSLLKEYMKQADPIVEEYLKLGPYFEIIKIDSNIEVNNFHNLTPAEVKRLDIINRYFKVAEKYVDLEIKHELESQTDLCLVCNYDMTDVFMEESGEQVCPECQTTRYTLQPGGNKGVKANVDPRRYDVITTFRRELHQFQGKEKVHIEDEVYQKLDEYFINLGMPPAEVIRQQPQDEYGKTLGTNLNALLVGLKEIGYPSLYKHANKIGAKLWNWKLHDLKEISGAIIQDFIDIQKQFSHVDKERSSNICSQHRLLQQLRLRGVKVALTDFKLPGLSALLESEEIYKKMVEKTHHPYLPLFPNQETVNSEEGFLLVNKKNNTIVER